MKLVQESLDEKMFNKFRKNKSLKKEPMPIEYVVNTIDKMEELGVDRDEAITTVEKMVDFFHDFYDRGMSPREVAPHLINAM